MNYPFHLRCPWKVVCNSNTRQCSCGNPLMSCARVHCVGFVPSATAWLRGEMCDKLALWRDAGSASLLASPTERVLMWQRMSIAENGLPDRLTRMATLQRNSESNTFSTSSGSRGGQRLWAWVLLEMGQQPGMCHQTGAVQSHDPAAAVGEGK